MTSKWDKRTWVCQNMMCLKSTVNQKEFRVCASCKTTAYCSRDCQKAHWKTHKATCPKTRESNDLVTDSLKGVDFTQPGISNAKLVKDLEIWTNTHSGWLYMCFVCQIHNSKDNPDRWRTHGVKVEVVPHNTRQAVYRFTLHDICSISYQETREKFKGTPTAEDIGKIFDMVQSMESPGGMIGCGIVVVVSLDTLRCIPYSFDLGVSYSVPLNYSPDKNLLKAPEGTNAKLYDELLVWWAKQRAAVIFCCVNMFNLRPGSPLVSETICFDIMHRLNVNKLSHFAPLKPVKQPWFWLEARHPKLDYPRLNEFKRRRVSPDGEPGIVVAATVVLIDLTIIESYFICDWELETIEKRDDWEHHYYTLLADYDLRY